MNFDEPLKLYVTPLIYLTLVADQNDGIIANETDKLMYLKIIQWIEKVQASAST
jgi:hypothetical protein